MPYKVWAVNEILTAADMNTYVGNQTILSFAGTAARATAIGTAVEGMLSYVGSGVVEVYAGTVTGWTAISGGGGGNVADDSIQPNFNTITNIMILWMGITVLVLGRSRSLLGLL